MSDLYYSERFEGEMPRESDEVSSVFWGGFVAFIESRSRDGWFAERYPVHCSEAPLPVDTDSDSLGAAFRAHNPRVTWPLDAQATPELLDVLDAIEFFGRIISQPLDRHFHKFPQHRHIIAFDRREGFLEYQREVNTMFRRCGLQYEFEWPGEIKRIGPPVLREEIHSAVFSTGDSELDNLLGIACQKFQDPDPQTRKEALEKLWDAWERLKTILPGDKRTSVKALLDSAVAEPTFRGVIEDEARSLTGIGNTFLIRHWETDKVPISGSHHIDYLFHRMFALVLMLLRAGKV